MVRGHIGPTGIIIAFADSTPDLQARNFSFAILDEEFLRKAEEDAIVKPPRRKIIGDYTVYESQGLSIDWKPGPPVLCDFGEARAGREYYTDLIQPEQYRAPEVTLGIPWTYNADIWNVGVMVSLRDVDVWSEADVWLLVCRPGICLKMNIYFPLPLRGARSRMHTSLNAW